MKKRTYKQMQNRLYREIKRRIIAENQWFQKIKFSVEQQKVETLRIRNIVDKHVGYEYIKRSMASKMADKLLEDGYIVFMTAERNDGTMYDCAEIEARLKVIR